MVSLGQRGRLPHDVEAGHSAIDTGHLPPSQSLAEHYHQRQCQQLLLKTIQWPYYRVDDSNMTRSVGFWLANYDDADTNLFGKSILAYVTQTDRRNGEGQIINTLPDYRYR